MRHKNNDFIFRIAPVIAGTFAAALFFNIVYQAQIMYRKNAEIADIAVFIYKSYELSAFEVKKKIVSLDNIKEAKYMPSEDTYQDVLSGDSEIKDILLSGENPFSSYFLVKLNSNTLDNAENACKQIALINGVEDVKYDKNAYIFAEKLQKVKVFYIIFLIICAAVLFINVSVKIIYKLLNFEAESSEYFNSAAWGILYGLIGILLYYFSSVYILKFDELIVPLKYLLAVWPVGIFLNVVLKD